MRWLLILIPGAIASAAPATLCDLAKFLPAHDGERASLRGEIFAHGKLGVFAMGSNCDTPHPLQIGMYGWPLTIHLSLSDSPGPARESARQLQEQFDRAAGSGKVIQAFATVTGRLETVHRGDAPGFGPLRKAPAQMHVAAIGDVSVAPLAKSKDLPVIPICDLFRDLQAYRGKRIRVRGVISGGMEGAWLSDYRCNNSFVTDGYRWPVSLSYSYPDYAVSSLAEAYRISPAKRTKRVDPWASVSMANSVVTGVLRTAESYQVMCRQGQMFGIGFGHMGAAAGELLVEFSEHSSPVAGGSQPAKQEPVQPCPVSRRLSPGACAALSDAVAAARGGCADRVRELTRGKPELADTAMLAASAAGFQDAFSAAMEELRTLPALLMAAIKAGDADAVERVLRQSEAYSPLREGASPWLSMAARYGNPRIIRLLIAKRAHPGRSGPLGTPIHVAVLYERWDNLRALIAAGFDVNAKDTDGRTPLASFGIASVEGVRELVKAGVDVNSPVHGDRTVLMRAVRSSGVEVVRALLEAGAVTGAQDKQGNTALHHAVEARRADLISLLLQFGAVRDQRNAAGQTPLDVARRSGYVELVSALTQ